MEEHTQLPDHAKGEYKKRITKSIRNFIYQLAIVVIGIMITFAGSSLIEKAAKKRETREMLHTVRAELETNKALLNLSANELREELYFYTLLDSCRHDFRQIPEDTLHKYTLYPFWYNTSIYRRDAIEALKSSALVHEIPDKTFVVSLLGIYTSFMEQESFKQEYYKMKRECVHPLILNADSELIEQLKRSSSYQEWDIYWKDNRMRNFILTSVATLQGMLLEIDRLADNMNEILKELEKY